MPLRRVGSGTTGIVNTFARDTSQTFDTLDARENAPGCSFTEESLVRSPAFFQPEYIIGHFAWHFNPGIVGELIVA